MISMNCTNPVRPKPQKNTNDSHRKKITVIIFHHIWSYIEIKVWGTWWDVHRQQHSFVQQQRTKWGLILHTSEEEEVAEATEDDERHHPVQRVDRDDHKVNVKWPAPHVSQIQRIQAKCSVWKLPATGRTSVPLKSWNNKKQWNKCATCN